MSIKRVSRSFKDISLSFEPHPVTKDLPILKNERAIIRSVRNIVETIPSERFFNLDFGSDARSSAHNSNGSVVVVLRIKLPFHINFLAAVDNKVVGRLWVFPLIHAQKTHWRSFIALYNYHYLVLFF